MGLREIGNYLYKEKRKKLNLPVIEFDSALSLFAICVAAHELAEQVRTGFHCKSLPHTVAPVPDHPGSHVIVTFASIAPVKEFIAALSELSTCVAGQFLGQLVSSLGKRATRPTGHAEQELASLNG